MVRSRMQRSLSVAAVSAITLASMPLSSLAAFSDVRSSDAHAEAINALQESGVLQGYADGSFRAGSRINRAEFLKIVVEAAFTDAEIDDLLSRVRLAPMDDVDTSAWYARYVMFAMAKGIVEGYPDGTFKPEQDVNFVEAGKILSLAYGQEPRGGGEWYAPYVRALDGSKAIPPDIEALDSPLTRGEMAEMMWRISEGITSKESVGYMNLKYPDATVNFSSDDVQRAGSCADLAAVTQEAMSSQTYGYGYRGVMLEDAAMPSGAVPPAPPAAAQARDAESNLAKTGGGADGDYSATNVQVEGVDEADIVKTDGEYLYMVRGQTVKIVKAAPASAMKEAASIDLAAVNLNPSEMYVDDGTLVVIGSSWIDAPSPGPFPVPMLGEMRKMIAPGGYYPYPSGKSMTNVRIYDVSNPASPSLTRAVAFEGSGISSRKIEDKLYLVVQQQTHWFYPALRNEGDLMPTFDDSAKKLKDEPVTRCGNVAILPHVEQPDFMTVAVIPTDDVNAEVKREVVLGSAQNVYMSAENLYVATTQWNYQWDSAFPVEPETTNIFRFELTDDGVAMRAKGSVPGHILNQFSMDEHGTSFRIATTRSQSWTSESDSRPMTNNLYVLNRAMDTVGDIEDIAPGEQIYSVRFMGDRAYMVTFRTIDPLFVIDVADPRNPRILGKLKIPGFSNYLHPYDATHIIGFGKDAVESKDGSFAWQQGMKIAMFDVSDVEHPKELHAINIGDRGTDSPLLWNHKALLFEKDRGLLAFPISISKVTDAQRREQGDSAYGSPVFQGAQVYDVSLKDGFTLRGEITHYDEDAAMKAGDVYYAYGRDVERIVRVGETLYTVSQYGVAAHAEKTVKEQGMLKFKD